MDEQAPDPEWRLAYGNNNEWEDHLGENKGCRIQALQYQITQYRAGPCNLAVEHSPSMLEITGSILNTAEQKNHTRSAAQVVHAQGKHPAPTHFSTRGNILLSAAAETGGLE